MPAKPTTTWRASCARKWGRAPSRPCCIASPAAATLAVAGLELGLYVSFSGILTFKNPTSCAPSPATLPPDRILVETDAPYLAPVPYRGKRNEPAYVAETAKVLAEARGVSPDEIARADHRELLPPVLARCRAPAAARRMTLTLHHPGLRLIRRRAAPGARLGRLRSEQSEEPPAALLAAGRAARAQAASRACWSTPRRTCASSCSTPRSTGSTACSITHEHADHTPRHRRPARAVRPQAPARRHVSRTSRRRAR